MLSTSTFVALMPLVKPEIEVAVLFPVELLDVVLIWLSTAPTIRASPATSARARSLAIVSSSPFSPEVFAVAVESPVDVS